jgi:hypothetical protein
MVKFGKVLLGLATIWPFFYILLFFGFIASFMVFAVTSEQPRGKAKPAPDVPVLPQEQSEAKPNEPPPALAFGMIGLFGMHCFTIFLSFVLMAIYIYHLFNTERVPNDKKALWAVVLFLGAFFAMPVYWYLYIWCDVAKPVSAPERA